MHLDWDHFYRRLLPALLNIRLVCWRETLNLNVNVIISMLLKWWNEKEINNLLEVLLGVVIPTPGGPELYWVSITVQSENHIIMEISLYNQYFIYWHTRGDHTTWYHFSIIAWQLILYESFGSILGKKKGGKIFNW